MGRLVYFLYIFNLFSFTVIFIITFSSMKNKLYDQQACSPYCCSYALLHMKYNYVGIVSYLGALLYQLLEKDTLVSALGLVGYKLSSI